MIFYIYDANYIMGIPIKNRSEQEFLRAYKEVYMTWKREDLDQNFTNSTMNRQQKYKNSSHHEIQTYNSPRLTCIDKTQQNGQYELGKITSSQSLQVSIRYFRLQIGAA